MNSARRSRNVLVTLAILSWASGAVAVEERRLRIGEVAPAIEFTDIRSLPRTLDDFGPKAGVVIVAVSTSCPIAAKSLPVLDALERRYRARGVQFVAINVGPDDTIADTAAQALEFGVEMPFVKDFGGKAAQALGLSRTPEVALLDSGRRLIYRGRIDDRQRLGGAREEASRHELEDAIEALLAGKPVNNAETPVDGCRITFGEPEPPEVGRVTYHHDVAPILQKHCQSCHQPGTAAPFALKTYRDAASQAEAIAEVVHDRRMPPWHADRHVGRIVNARGLDDRERAVIARWVADGRPKGDPARGIAPAPAPLAAASWRIGEPDQVIAMAFDQRLSATGFVDYKYAILPYIFAEDTWAQALEIHPDNPRVVHHANLATIRMGEPPSTKNFLTGHVPGGDPMVMDEGIGIFIPKGSALVLQIHFVTTGKPERCNIAVGLRFPRTLVDKRLYHHQVTTRQFVIAPFAPAHRVSSRRVLDFDATGVGMFSHMHVRGKDMTFQAHKPDGSSDTLLRIPNYDFDWQESYRWARGTEHLPKGTALEVVAHFDNSAFNPYNPDPSATVREGEQTHQEMMYGFVFFTRDDEKLGLAIDPKTGRVTTRGVAK
jgi:hypothetical protein